MQIIPHTFNRYELSDEEQRAGQALTLSNSAVIQNLIAEKAEAKIGLILDTKDIEAYMQNEAYLRGQIDILNYLLACNAALSISQTSLDSGEM